MKCLKLDLRILASATVCLAILCLCSDTVVGQKSPLKKPASKATSRAKATDRSKTVDRNAPAADKIILRDGKELLGQVVEPTAKGGLLVVARREWLHDNLPERTVNWEGVERTETAMAMEQWHRRQKAWRQERPPVAAHGDRITAWLDRELSKEAGGEIPSTLIAVQLAKGEATSVQKRGDQAARSLRAAWILGLPEPESSPMATLMDSIVGRGMVLEEDDPVAIDSLLPLSVESDDRWLFRRAATEVLCDEGLRFVRFGNTIIPEPLPGQMPDATLGPKLVEGTIKDVLSGGRADPLPERLRAVAERSRIGMMVTRIEIATDFSSVAAESTLYYHGKSGWDRGGWREATVRVGEVPPFVLNMVAKDPQVKALLDFVDSIGGGLVSPEMKQRGLSVGTSAGGAAIMARAALTRSLVSITFDLEPKKAVQRPSAKNKRG